MPAPGRDSWTVYPFARVRNAAMRQPATHSARFVKLQRQPVGVGEEGEALPGVLVAADRLAGHPGRGQALDHRLQPCHPERQVAQSLRLGPARTGRRRRKREQLELSAVGQGQVQFPGVACGAVMFGLDRQSQHADVEIAGAVVIGTDHSNVVDAEQRCHGIDSWWRQGAAV